MSRSLSMQPPDLANQVFSRTAGAELISGNRVRLLRNGAENYPAWLDAIEHAQRFVHIETYIIYEDAVGRQFADLLCAKATQGVRVRLLYDWFGSWGRSSARFWRRLTASGVEVRRFNPPSFVSPLACFSRNHRKMLSVDGRVAYVTGLCIGEHWAEHNKRKVEPWRDTGVEIEGPAVFHIDHAFSESWASAGKPLSAADVGSPPPEAGEVALRVVGSVTSGGGVYRLDQLMATLARKSIWLSDAYFAGTASYIHGLRSAARSGVDVRLLIPGATDLPVVRAISRAGLRPLLEAGVRIFEWNGSMMHAKTSVVDGCWSRVGSTNMNLASWMGNWELDVVIENEKFGQEMEKMYLDDLEHSTEIVLKAGWRKPITPVHPLHGLASQPIAIKASRTAAGMVQLGRTVGAAISGSRELGPAEAVIMFWSAALLIVIATILFFWPLILAIPFAILCLWLALSLSIHAIALWWHRR